MKIENKVSWGFVLSILAVAYMGFASLFSTNSLVKNNDWLTHTYEVIASLEELQQLLEENKAVQYQYFATLQEGNLQTPWLQ